MLLAYAGWPRSTGTVAWTLGLSFGLGLLSWLARVGTPAASLAGAILTASLMFSTAGEPFSPWRTALVPVLAFLVMTSLATRYGRAHKERLGTAEQRNGRVTAQVCANMGIAALVATPAAHAWLADAVPVHLGDVYPWFVIGLAALAEAAADTISSEIGQVLGGTPIMLTSFRRVPAGTDGAVSLAGSVAGVLAAGIVAGSSAIAPGGGASTLLLAWAGGVFGLFFDSLLGATAERAGWLNNDAVNFLSTGSASAFALLCLMMCR